jgi:Glycosyltransferase like family 2
LVQQGANLGRGAARARGIIESRHPLVLGCDATVLLPETFVEQAVTAFTGTSVAAVFGHFVERKQQTVVQRWRARHLYKQGQPRAMCRNASLITAGAVLNRERVLAVGNYNPRLRHSEDAELGARLLAAGFEVISDPKLEFECLQGDSLVRLFERYWRWYAGPSERVTLRGYARNVWYGLRFMIRRDLQEHDWTSALISLLMPHNQFWRSVYHRLTQPADSASLN